MFLLEKNGVFNLDGEFFILDEGFKNVDKLGGNSQSDQFEDQARMPDFIECLLDIEEDRCYLFPKVFCRGYVVQDISQFDSVAVPLW